jgi:diguanylate cyclase (GGDEF)-like protein
MGGEEFCILIDHGAVDAAFAFAERIGHTISAEPVDCGDVLVTVTASIGVASVQPTDENYASVMNGADFSVYRAKEAG